MLSATALCAWLARHGAGPYRSILSALLRRGLLRACVVDVTVAT
jgi:hypothetical protein